MPIANESIDFSDISGGKNSAFPRHAIAKNQVCDSLNLIHEVVGASRAPGFSGVSATALFSGPIRGSWTFTQSDGTELAIYVSDSKIWVVDLVAGTKTEIGSGSITADTQCYACNLAGKLWIVNGTDFVKVESSTVAYRVQILPPTSGTMAANTGGSIPAGIYYVYVAYARKNSQGQYLYSYPYQFPSALGYLEINAGAQTIDFSVPASADPQVTHKVIFMTDAGGAEVHFYGEVTNATVTFSISSAAARNGAILMSTVSASNVALPISPDGIFAWDDKLFVWDSGTPSVYWSLKTDINPFDIERFLSQNFRTLGHSVSSLFGVDSDLFFNHPGVGVSRAIGSDMSSVIKLMQKGMWYLDCLTPDGRSNVVFYKGVVFGLTNDGFRFFNGDVFSEDVSFHIKPDVDTIVAGFGSGNIPCAIINRRASKRTEYRFSYRNLNYGGGSNNDQRVFNLDFYFDANNSKKTWECWENGFSGALIYGGRFYGSQSYSSGGQIVKESGVSDINCYDRKGTFNAVKFLKQAYLLSKTVIDDLDSVTVWGSLYSFATLINDIDGNIILFDANYQKYSFTIKGVAPAVAVLPSESSGLGLALPFIMSPQYPLGASSPMPYACRGNSVAIELSQVSDDESFFIYKIQLPRAKQIKNNLT